MDRFSKFKVFFILSLVFLSCIVFYFGNFSNVKIFKGIKLGLDLQGGSYLLLELDQSSLKKDYLDQTYENVKNTLSDKYSYNSFVRNSDNFVIEFSDKSKIHDFQSSLLLLDKNLKVKRISDNQVEIDVTDDGYKYKLADMLSQSIEVVRKRVDQFGTNEPLIQKKGDTDIIVEVPGVSDPEQIKRIIGKTARISFHLVDEAASFSEAPLEPGYTYMYDDANKFRYAIKDTEELTGKNLKSARLSFNQQNQPVVSFVFDSIGAKKFSDITTQNVGKLMAIVLDGKVISAPKINTPITGGSGIIEGRFTMNEAQELALLLQAGSLPVPLSIVEERVVGPTLGKDSIKAGINSLVVGSVLVLIFMAIFYRKLGLISNIALIANIFLILGVLSIVGITLTLPGIVGIILTIGMAVDANILVYERYNYEIRYAKPHIAMLNSFKRVYSTLMDSNVTTLFAALFLFSFGSGTVKGFAVTLIIGVLTSLFSIMFITKMLVDFFYLKNLKNKRQ